MNYSQRFNSKDIEILRPVIESLDEKTKEKLAIKEGEHNISFWSQFKSFYWNKRLKYPIDLDDEIPKTAFLLILAENQFLIEQIGRQKEIIENLFNLKDNWNLIHTTGGKSNTASKGNNTNVIASIDTTNTKASSDNFNKSSDANSYLENVNLNDDLIPINQYNKAKLTDSKDDNRTSGSLNNSEGSSESATGFLNISKTTNPAEDYLKLVSVKYRSLRMEFLAKFKYMFLVS